MICIYSKNNLNKVETIEIIKNENVEIENLSQNNKTKGENQLFLQLMVI